MDKLKSLPLFKVIIASFAITLVAMFAATHESLISLFAKEGKIDDMAITDAVAFIVILLVAGVTYYVSKQVTNKSNDFKSQIDAIGKSQAVISFNMDGTIIDANDNFLKVLGYKLEEVKGKHHSMFVESKYKESVEYSNFWDLLRRGEYQQAEYKRIAKSGNTVWIQASYNPIKDEKGKPYKVVKFASDTTAQKAIADEAVKLKFALDTVSAGVMMADSNLDIMYTNPAVVSMLSAYEKDIQKDLPAFNSAKLMGVNIDSFHKNPAHQRGMLEKLTGTFKGAIKIGGRNFDLVANPVYSANKERLGTTVEWRDITEALIQKVKDADSAGQIEAIGKSQAVISFNMDGTIIEANQNFLSTLGYTLDEIKGKHHSMFVEPAYKTSADYHQFWENLNRGQYQAGEYSRLGRNGKEVWIQASYNPINGPDGKPFKVVKYATDTTLMVTTRLENEKGMKESVQVLKDMAAGDLTNNMKEEYHGTFGDIKKALNATIDQLKSTVANIKSSAQSVNGAASEISAGSKDLSERTEQQASTLEETAASMEEMTGAVRQNTENASNANELAAKAKEVAGKGGNIVRQVVEAMSGIEDSSKKISDIIGVIDDIAFQTNLLALNAAVEAARAGDAGKGFAVVASEVRSLAGRSAAASKDIKALINSSVEQVASGSKLVNEAGTTLTHIEKSVDEVASLVSEISAASGQQSTGIEEINSAVAQMDEMTQQNAALVEESTAAAQSLVEQANELERLVSAFKIDESYMQNQSQQAARHEPVVRKPMQSTKPATKPAAHVMKQDATKPKKVASGGKKYDEEWEEF